MFRNFLQNDVFLLAIAIIVLVALIVVPWLIRVYNMLVMGRNRVHEMWSNIEVQLNRRYELIPNLVGTVKGYAKHEDQTFTKVTEARSRAMAAKTPSEHAAAESMLAQSLMGLYAVAEAYPELKANQNFLGLQRELVGIEDAIQQARTQYNAIVRRFNTGVQTFPTNIAAGILGFKAFDFYNAPDAANENVKAEF